MPDPGAEFDAVKKRVLAEFATKGFGDKLLSFEETTQLRAYAKSRTDLLSENLGMEEAIWKWLYDRLTRELREISPNVMQKIEALEETQEAMQDLREAIEKKIRAHPHDFGIRVWWGFVIIGVLVGWMRSANIWPITLYGIPFWIAGMFFCIFALDSAEVQSKIAIVLHQKLGWTRIAMWLYNRALTIR